GARGARPPRGQGGARPERARPQRGGRAGGPRGGPETSDRSRQYKPEFDQKILDIRRVARVVSGGRRFSFSVTIVVGNRAGSVGVGLGKAGDTPLAIEKATRDARRNLIVIPLTESKSIPHDTAAKYGASIVEFTPVRGRGLVAGSSVRSVLELAGITDVSAKIHSRSKNKLNNARAAVKALEQFVSHSTKIKA
ncbi:MAG: 30S ribosomal protein S5, partial [Patescibacteria group bacterium]|nr:30S ribosomal protein S5 [Patescibacteria group bacterium]